MARNQYFNQLVSPVSSWHREQHDGIAYLDADFISICPACAKPLFIADLIYNKDSQFKPKSEWLNRPYQHIAQSCQIPFYTIYYTVNEISDQERPITEFNIVRNYPSFADKKTLTPDQFLEYLEWKVQQHIPNCKAKNYLLQRVTAATETNNHFKRLENYVKILS